MMKTRFIKALEEHDLKELKQIPKSDLHSHTNNAGNSEFIAARTGYRIPKLNRPFESMEDMHRWVGEHIGNRFSSKEERRILIEAAFQQAADDGVTILEIGEDIWANGHCYGGNIEELIGDYQAAHAEYAPNVDFRFQIGLSRHCPIKCLEEWIEPFLTKDIFFSIDLYCDETAQPIRNFIGLYRMAKKKGLLLKAHVGEWGDAESVREAIEILELDEVQHGISAAESESVMKWLAKNEIQLNICPTSNLMLGRVSSYETHPIRVLYDNGVKVTVNSDDILVFGSGVSEEFMALYEAGLFSPEELNEIRETGLNSRRKFGQI